MSTKYIASNWRLPNEENSGKSDNYGLSFNGSSEYITAGAIDITGDKSISMWFKTPSASTTQGVFEIQPDPNTSDYLIVWIFNSKILASADSNKSFSKESSVLSSNTWYNLVITKSAGQIEKIYINGQDDTQSTTSFLGFFGGRNNTYIGATYQGTAYANELNGSISEVAIFDYALSEPQISTLYGSSSLGAGNPMALKPAPVAFYPLGDNSASNPLTQPNEAVEDASVFDGNGTGFVVTKTGDEFDISTKFSFSLWLNMQTIVNYDHVFGASNPTWTEGFGLLQDGSTGTLRFWVDQWNTVGKFVQTDTTLDTNKWYHICGTFDNTNGGLLYVDGQVQNSGTAFTSASLTSVDLNKIIRIFGTTSGWTIDALISNFQLWNTELLASEVTTLYNSGVPLLTGTQPQASSLKAWYKLDQSANWEADSSGDWQIPDAVSAYPQSFLVGPGNSANIQTPNLGMNHDQYPYSISYWYNPHLSSTRHLIYGSYDNDPIVMFAGSTSLLIFVGGQGYVTAGNPIFNKWNHIVYKRINTSTIKLYVNGVFVYEKTDISSDPSNLNDETLRIGSNQNQTGKEGFISNVQLWNADLTDGSISTGQTAAGQIETLYNNGVPLTTAIASDNLKAWYKLDNTATFSTNWSVPDDSGNGNTGTSSGMTEQNLVNNNVSALNGESNGMTSANLVLSDLTRAVPYDSYSFNFDSASSDYINLGNNITQLYNGAFSISYWVNHKTISGNQHHIMIPYNQAGWSNPYVRLMTRVISNGRLEFRLDGWYNGVDTAIGTITTGSWYHICCTFDGTTNANGIKVYINAGTLTTGTSSVTSITSSTNDLFLGTRYSGGPNESLDGKLSNLSIFNEALTSTEVLKLYANGVPQDLSNFTPSPVAWYPLGSNSFWNGSQWTVRDMIGSNNGTSQNIGIDGLVGDSPRSSANGVGTNNSIPENLVGTTKWSDNNSWSINMSSTARVEDTP